jgi:SET domain-containing protein
MNRSLEHRKVLKLFTNIMCLSHYKSIDATYNAQLGRLVNDDSDNPNCEMVRVVVDNLDHLCLFATRDIAAREELSYDYGPHNKTPWRIDVSCKQNFHDSATIVPQITTVCHYCSAVIFVL